MTKYLSAKEKAKELGITTSGLAKTRHLYKHIKKSPHKYLYFAEEDRDIVRPNMVNAPGTPGNSRPPRSHRRRNVPFGKENYSKAPGGSGEKLKVLNQMRAKASLEGNYKPEELHSLNEAMAFKIKENHKDFVEQKQIRLQSEIMAEDRRRQDELKRKPGGLINLSTKGYPHSLLPTGHDPDLVTSKSKWRDAPSSTGRFKYYW
tara:strand:+ start:656 stop:1267 length:612 start_codon:yes stop_codon:yes gene_type:complete